MYTDLYEQLSPYTVVCMYSPQVQLGIRSQGIVPGLYQKSPKVTLIKNHYPINQWY